MAGKNSNKPKKTASKRPPSKGEQLGLYRKFYREIWGVICLLLAILVALSVFDKRSALARLFMGLVGDVGLYVLPVGLLLCFVALVFHGGQKVAWRVVCSLAFAFVVSAIGHLAINASDAAWNSHLFPTLYTEGVAGDSGGIIGGLIALAFSSIGGKAVAWAVCILLLIVTLLASLNLTITGLLRAINKHRERQAKENLPQRQRREPAEVIVEHVAQRRAERRLNKVSIDYDLPVDDPLTPKVRPAKASKPKKKLKSPDEYVEEGRRAALGEEEKPAQTEDLPLPLDVQEPLPLPSQEEAGEKISHEQAKQAAAEVAAEIVQAQEQPKETYTYPPIELLREAKPGAVDGTAEMRDNAKRLQDTLSCFNVDAQIINVIRGPSVTMYELELAQGVRLNRLTGLADDIALSLGAPSVRISAIPDKISVVGIEVPNKLVSVVQARDVIGSSDFARAKSKTSFAVGKDISGNCIIGDISCLPHLLIAGTTGSGKSVCMNSLIISLLYKATPAEIRLIMIDPKMVEFGVYNGIPHLLIPVVTDAKKAAGSLQWTVTEMMRRYRLMSEAGVRDLESYNRQMRSIEEGPELEQIVVVIDELADLMLVAAKEVEESICRIAQMGRAAGIHLVIATQRPSADVITGLMKANIPSRIAFAVSSAMESRIILDTMGAEKLVGRGDMLFAPLGKGRPKRVQGCFITDEEVQAVVEFTKSHSEANYSEEVQAQIDLKAAQTGKGGGQSAAATGGESHEGDELLPAAVEVILETGQASVSMLQRRLKLGYARAARIVDEMEEKGIVGPFEGSKPRQLLITKEQWQAMQGGAPLASPPASPPVEEELP